LMALEQYLPCQNFSRFAVPCSDEKAADFGATAIGIIRF
jgi:hypothetical protein